MQEDLRQGTTKYTVHRPVKGGKISAKYLNMTSVLLPLINNYESILRKIERKNIYLYLKKRQDINLYIK